MELSGARELTTPQAEGPGGTITGSSEPYMPGQNTYTGMSMQEEEEPEVVKSVFFFPLPPATYRWTQLTEQAMARASTAPDPGARRSLAGTEGGDGQEGAAEHRRFLRELQHEARQGR